MERLRFVPVWPQTRGQRIIPEFAVPVAPDPVVFRELSRISHVPVKPVRSFAMFLRPRCDQARWWVQVKLMPGSAPATDQDEGSRQVVISGLNHRAFDLAVYASQWRSPAPTQDLLPAAGPALPDGIGYPQGFNERFHIEMILLSRASWRKDAISFAGLRSLFEESARA